MQLLYEKIIFLFMLFILGFAAGGVPFFLRERCFSPSRLRDDLVSFFNCFSAGVFFSTFFMHMMPEAQEEFLAVFGDNLTYPFAELLVSSGFFFVMFVEQIIVAWYEKKSKPTGDDNITSKTEESMMSSLNNNDKPNYQTMEKPATSFRRNESTSTAVTQMTCCDEESAETQKATCTIEMNVTASCHSNSDVSNNDCESDPQNNNNHCHFDPNAHSTVRAFILLFALSTHALFEGLAIGFQSTTSALRSLVIAVAIHKMALAFSYGVSVVNNKSSCAMVFSSLLVFSIMAPIGIGVGSGLAYAKDTNATIEMVVAVMQAIASGTFVYVIFIEILPHEFSSSKRSKKVKKVLSLAAGFALMSALQAVPHQE